MKPLSNLLRAIVAIASLSLIATYFLPLWSIQLWAPQYPEGLEMTIWIDHLDGGVETINMLNHYIGMKSISDEMFPEFLFIKYIMAGYILLGLLVVIFNKKSLIFTWATSLVLGSVLLLVDMYRWGYDYGHNLDPTAAIKVPGLSYQPPLIGYKELLNFGAYSMADTGGWIFGAVVALSVFCVLVIFNKKKKDKVGISEKVSSGANLTAVFNPVVALLFVAVFLFTSCNKDPRPLVRGKDTCTFCKMGISDLKFAAELVTDKGKVYTFDDVSCMVRFMEQSGLDEEKCAHVLISDYSKPDVLINAKDAYFLESGSLRSPMAGNVVGFANQQEAGKKKQELEGEVVAWEKVKSIF